MLGPPCGLDVTHRVIAAIAHELWLHHGGNDVVNWLEAEHLLAEALGRAHVQDSPEANPPMRQQHPITVQSSLRTQLATPLAQMAGEARSSSEAGSGPMQPSR